MKVGIISFAHMHAYSYAECLNRIDGVELAGVADDNHQRGQRAAERFDTSFVPDYRELLQRDLDAVIVCTENRRHTDVVVDAARAGKHILCEKPLATTLDDAQRMIQVCRESHVMLETAFPVRFGAPVQSLKKMIATEQLGRILAMRGTNRGQNPGGWFVDNALSGGGAVLDHTVHVIDLMRWFLGSEVTEVYAELDTKFNDIPLDDCGILTLEFENGVIATHDPSWSRPQSYPAGFDVTLEVVGTKGVTTLDALSQHVTLYSDINHTVSRQFWGDSWDMGLIQDFVSSVRDGRAPLVTAEDGLKALEVALAAYRSAEIHMPVPLYHR